MNTVPDTSSTSADKAGAVDDPNADSNAHANAETSVAADSGPDAGQNAKQEAEPSAEDIAGFLRKHPRFFLEHGDLLLELKIPHESGRAVSLLERQVAVYRERQYAMDEQFNDIVHNANINDELFEKTRLVILDLLHCRDLPSLTSTIADRIRNDFDATEASLVLVSDSASGGLIPSIPSTAVRTALGELYEKQRTWCGTLNKAQQTLLFPGHSGAVVSAAIVPLHLPEDSAFRTRFGLPLLLIGSSENGHFNSSLDTLFLDFIGEVLTVHLQHLPVTY